MSASNPIFPAAACSVLDLGCGADKLPGALGVDLHAQPGVDLVHDLNVIPWPLPEGQFAAIHCRHVLEHLDDLVGVLNEIHRVGKTGARVSIVTPHFSSLSSWEDPTHRRHFARRSFAFFDAAEKHALTNRRLRLLSAKITFGGGFWDALGRLHCHLWPNFWEKQLAFIWRARHIEVELEVIK
jgi:SAM-dependent methyltransferase